MATKKATKGAAPVISPSMPSSAEERKWKTEDALRDIERAERHKSDPTLMKDVQALARDKMRDLAKITVQTAPKTIKRT